MADFVKKLADLKAWRLRKAKINCDCTAEAPITCRQWKRDTEEERACTCTCHASNN